MWLHGRSNIADFRQANLLPLPPPPAHFACRWQACSSFWSSSTHPGVHHPLGNRGEECPFPEEDDRRRGCQEGAAEEPKQQQLEETGGIVPGGLLQKQTGQVWTSKV